MNSVIHYKFKTSKKWQTLHFDGAVLSVMDVKRRIVALNKLNKTADDFDLRLTNTATGESKYTWTSL